jgi:hypothetical protein
MGISSPEDYDDLALIELEAAAAVDDPAEKKRRLNQASAFATLAELSREMARETAETGRIWTRAKT